MKGVGERIKKRRLEMGLTQEQLGGRIGLSSNAIAGYETDRREPNLEKLIQLAYALDVTPDYLLGIDYQPSVIYKKLLESAGFEIIERGQHFVELITPAETYCPPAPIKHHLSRRVMGIEKIHLDTFLLWALRANADNYAALEKALEGAFNGSEEYPNG